MGFYVSSYVCTHSEYNSYLTVHEIHDCKMIEDVKFTIRSPRMEWKIQLANNFKLTLTGLQNSCRKSSLNLAVSRSLMHTL